MITWQVLVDGVELIQYHLNERNDENYVIAMAMKNPAIRNAMIGKNHVMNEVLQVGPSRKILEITTRPESHPEFLTE